MADKFKIIPKKSNVAGKVPLSTDLLIGELAVNLKDKIIYSKNPAGDIFIFLDMQKLIPKQVYQNLLANTSTVTIANTKIIGLHVAGLDQEILTGYETDTITFHALTEDARFKITYLDE